MSNLKLSWGATGFKTAEALAPVLDPVRALGITEIDTAQAYGTNEQDLGTTEAASKGFIISSKILGGWAPGVSLKADNVRAYTPAALKKLKVEQLDILYIHGPDPSIPLTEWMPIIDEQFKAGLFRRFGISNFSPAQVQELYDFNKENGYVLPSVYQGNYNAISRTIETTLFPLLRSLNITFYAYSPVAGGFLTKRRADLEAGTAGGRFTSDGKHPMSKMYQGMYMKPELLDGLSKWGELVKIQGDDVTAAELAYRWVYYHSELKQELGDTVIFGASSIAQIETTIEGLQKGPLKPEVVKGVDEIWESVRHVVAVNNYEATMTKAKA